MNINVGARFYLAPTIQTGCACNKLKTQVQPVRIKRTRHSLARTSDNLLRTILFKLIQSISSIQKVAKNIIVGARFYLAPTIQTGFACNKLKAQVEPVRIKRTRHSLARTSDNLLRTILFKLIQSISAIQKVAKNINVGARFYLAPTIQTGFACNKLKTQVQPVRIKRTRHSLARTSEEKIIIYNTK